VLERLARARPLARVADSGALHADPRGGLAVVAGDLEAVVRPLVVGAGTADRDRARLEKELADTEAQLASARARLADERFTSKAPAAVVEGARTREAELAERAAKLRARLGG
jgi:valyl-tRNA synthetase